jgi:hypothetical protein
MSNVAVSVHMLLLLVSTAQPGALLAPPWAVSVTNSVGTGLPGSAAQAKCAAGCVSQDTLRSEYVPSSAASAMVQSSGYGVGAGVGDGVGAGVGDGVGAGVGTDVGDGVGDGVGAEVGNRVVHRVRMSTFLVQS